MGRDTGEHTGLWQNSGRGCVKGEDKADFKPDTFLLLSHSSTLASIYTWLSRIPCGDTEGLKQQIPSLLRAPMTLCDCYFYKPTQTSVGFSNRGKSHTTGVPAPVCTQQSSQFHLLPVPRNDLCSILDGTAALLTCCISAIP